jgi:hypothetical protein
LGSGISEGDGERGPPAHKVREVVQASARLEGSGLPGHPVALQRGGKQGSELEVETARLATSHN